MIYTIYKITNLVNQKIYIGQTIRNLQTRFNEHCSFSRDRNSLIGKSIKKYGRNNFKIESIDISATSKDELDLLEIKYIKELNCLCPNGYNLSLGGGKLDFATIKRIKQIKKDKKSSLWIGLITKGKSFGARFTHNGMYYTSRLYETAKEAAMAYDIINIHFYKDEAILNFPELKLNYLNNEIKLVTSKEKRKERKENLLKPILNKRKENEIYNLNIEKQFENLELYKGIQYRKKTNNYRFHGINNSFKTAKEAAIARDIYLINKYADKIDYNKLNYPYKIDIYKTLKPPIYANKKYSNYRGVSFHNNKWMAQICINRKAKCIGYFIKEEDAAKAYDEKAKEFFKDKAKLNF